jgi:hypothetical protein
MVRERETVDAVSTCLGGRGSIVAK